MQASIGDVLDLDALRRELGAGALELPSQRVDRSARDGEPGGSVVSAKLL